MGSEEDRPFSILKDLLPFCFVSICGIIWIFSSRPNENVPAKNILRKIGTFMAGGLDMILSKDNKGLGPKKNTDPDEILGLPSTVKRLIFIRHGESDWNDIFNKGIGLSMIIRLIKALIREFLLLGTSDSIFLDSPLNEDGTKQAKDLAIFLSKSESGFSPREELVLQTLRGESSTSVIATSNLRRAISTTTIALWPRISKTKEKIVILSSLQEISRNVDAIAISGSGMIPNLSRLTAEFENPQEFSVERVYDSSENHGNKSSSFTGIKRLKAFNEWVFKRREDAVIAGGHSLWFKSYFQTFLPFNTHHIAKTCKITNSGVVSFDLHRAETSDGRVLYRIDPASIVVVYGGFTSK